MAVYNLWDGAPGKLLTGDVLNYPHRNSDGRYGSVFSMSLPKGIYKLEAWGSASGTFRESSGWSGGSGSGTGGYAIGVLTAASPLTVFLRPGGVGWNGGYDKYYGYATGEYWVGSGGGSDIRLLQDTLYHRVLVAGGGGHPGSIPPGGGGGGSSGTGGSGRNGGPGTQTSGGATGPGHSLDNHWYKNGGFGYGGSWHSNYDIYTGMGGGGWYGGGAGGYSVGTSPIGTALDIYYPGGGGSGFVLTSATAGNVPSGYALGSAYYLTDASTKTGKDAGDPIAEPDGTTAEAGHLGDGYIRITVIQGQLASPVVTDASEPTEGTLQISWNAVPNATGYRVENKSGTTLATLAASPYTETGIQPDKSYVRKIVATSPSFAESDPTTVNYTSVMKLDTPSNLRLSYTATYTTMQWNAVSGAESYAVTRDGAPASAVTGTSYRDGSGGAGTSHVYTVTAKAAGRWDSDAASIGSSNKPRLADVTNLTGTPSAGSVALSWTAAANAAGYDIYRDGTKIGSAAGTSYTDNTSQTGSVYRYTVVSRASGYWDSPGASVTVNINPRLDTPDLIEASQTRTSTTLNWALRSYGTAVTFTLRRNGAVIYQGSGKKFTDTGLNSGSTYLYTLTAAIPGSTYYDSLPATLYVLIGRDYTTVERQKDYLSSLRRDYTKLCRLRFLNPNGTTAFALDNNPRNRRSRTFIATGSVTANLQNGQRMSAAVTLDNAGGEYETAVNKIWFGQEVALDEGLILSNGEEYYRQTGVFLIDNPTEKIDPKTRTVTYRLLDKWAALDGTLGGNLEGTYEVPVGTNIFEPITELLTEDRGNGLPLDGVPPVYTEYYNDKTQTLTDGTTVGMTESPYTLTVSGDGGTKAQVILGLAGMVNAWVGYDNTGRLRIDPSQDDIIDIQKPVLWRFSQEEAQLLGMSYTVKKEDVYNDYIVVGEMLDDYAQPGGRATNYDPRSDTNVNLIGRKTKRESASGYATNRQCMDLAEWRLKRSSVLQKAVSVSCIQMMHMDLNSLVEIVRTDKEGNPVERHLIQGFTRPLAYNGAMTISAVSVNDLPVATVLSPDDPEPGPPPGNGYLRFTSPGAFTVAAARNTPVWDGTMEWSADGESWQEWDGRTISSGSGNALYLRGVGNSLCMVDEEGDDESAALVITGSSVSADGTAEALLDWKTVAAGGHPAMAEHCFDHLFYGDSALVKAPAFTATTLAYYCYHRALAGTGITEPPTLPATQLENSCYSEMFQSCGELLTAPALPAAQLANSCYLNMFWGCVKLTAPPELSAAELSERAYDGMFRGCTSLAALPRLPALSLPRECCYGMFEGCSSIKISATQSEEYPNEYRIPYSGTGSAAGAYALSSMFSYTGGTFTGTPGINTTYYTSNRVV